MDRRDFIAHSGLAASLFGMLGLQGAQANPANTAVSAPGLSSSAARQSFYRLVDTLREVEAQYLSPANKVVGAEAVADGERFLMHLLQTGLLFWMESDPANPTFKSYVTPDRKLLGDNPDARYFFAPVRGDLSYRIRGNLAGATFTSFTVDNGTAGGNPPSGSSDSLDDRSLKANSRGYFEIIASAERPAGAENWLRLTPESGQITTRHYYESKVCVAADPHVDVPLLIEPLQATTASVPNDQSIAEGIDRVANYVRAMTIDYPKTGDVPWVSDVPNTFNKPQIWAEQNGFTNLHAHYAMAPYYLQPDQALVITGKYPRCRFANVMLWNRYLQTYDYRHHPVSYNRVQSTLDADGGYQYVVAHQKPAKGDWLDTQGKAFGLIYWRFLLADGDVEKPLASVVPLSELL